MGSIATRWVPVVALVAALALVGTLLLQEKRRELASPSVEVGTAGAPRPEAALLGVRKQLGEHDVVMHLHAAEVSSDECWAALAEPDGSSSLLREKRLLHIRRFLRGQGSELEQMLVADLGGLRQELQEDNEPVLQGLPARLAFSYLLPSDERPLQELVAAIVEGVAPGDFVAQLEASGIDPTTTSVNNANLAKLAALHARPEVLAVLVSMGVDPTTDPPWGRRSVLDDIASLPKPPSETALAGVVRQLVAAGDRPYLPGTLATLEEWLPEMPLPELHPDATAALPRLAAFAAQVAAIDREWMQKVEAAARLEQRCESQLAAAVDDLPGAFQGTSLAAKRRHQGVFEKRAERWLADPQRIVEALEGTVSDVSPAVGPMGERMLEARANGEWDDAIDLADQLGGNAPWFLLHSALGSDAPIDAVLALLDRNGNRLPKNAAERVFKSWREDLAALAEALEPYGLDLHHVDAQGRGAFDLIAERLDLERSDGPWQFAEYLASRSVSVKPSPWGLDALDRVLISLVRFPWERTVRIRFARFLLDHGAPVEASHRELADMISLADQDAHRDLVAALPELA